MHDRPDAIGLRRCDGAAKRVTRQMRRSGRKIIVNDLEEVRLVIGNDLSDALGCFGGICRCRNASRDQPTHWPRQHGAQQRNGVPTGRREPWAAPEHSGPEGEAFLLLLPERNHFLVPSRDQDRSDPGIQECLPNGSGFWCGWMLFSRGNQVGVTVDQAW